MVDKTDHLRNRLVECDDPIAEVQRMVFASQEEALEAAKLAIDILMARTPVDG